MSIYLYFISFLFLGTKFNFKLLNTNTVTDYGLPYDYDSIMHYSMTAFSKSKSLATIIPKVHTHIHTYIFFYFTIFSFYISMNYFHIDKWHGNWSKR